MPKGVYTRIKPVWNKGLKGVQISWKKGKGIVSNPKALERAKQLFNDKIPSAECTKILIKEFGIKIHANVFWRKLFSKEERKIHRRELCSISKMGDKNPMKREEVRLKAGLSHLGQIPWNKNLTKEECLKHFKEKKMKGGRPKGYNHTQESKIKMSKNMKGKKHPNYNPSIQIREKYSKRMKENRKDYDFNKKMFKSFQRSITKPHKKVIKLIKEYTSLKTETNYCMKFGKIFGSIDEADVSRKIAIYIDGTYWHNFPKGRRWDKYCSTILKKKGWIVLRFWESDINKNPELVINQLKSL